MLPVAWKRLVHYALKLAIGKGTIGEQAMYIAAVGNNWQRLTGHIATNAPTHKTVAAGGRGGCSGWRGKSHGGGNRGQCRVRRHSSGRRVCHFLCMRSCSSVRP